jgi:hypothetical protein
MNKQVNNQSNDNQLNDKLILFNKVTSQIKKRIPDIFSQDIKYIKDSVNKLSYVIINQSKNDDTIISEIANILCDDIKKLKINEIKFNKTQNIDIHETLKQELGASDTANNNMPAGDFKDGNTALHLLNLFGTRNLKDIRSITNPPSLLAKAYLLLDRKYSYTTDNQTFKWNISTDGVANNSRNTVGTIAPLKDIIKIRMLPMRFPNTTGIINSSGRFSAVIDELDNQSYITQDRKFHFMFNTWYLDTTTPSTSPILLTDLGNSPTEFEFFRPIFDLTIMSISFGNPFIKLTLDSDTAIATLSANATKTQLTFASNPNIITGDIIYITGFNTTSPASDASIITQMNSQYGHIIDHTTPDYFISVDISAIIGVIIGNPFTIYLDSKRFIIQLELTYINSYK